MSAADTLTRGLYRPTIDAAPCMRRDPRMWDTGHKGNALAVLLCETACPLAIRDGCPKRNPNPRGVIVAGVPYDDYGRPVDVSVLPPLAKDTGETPTGPAAHHDEIMRRRAEGASWGRIAIAVGLTRDAVRAYGRWQETKARKSVSA